MRSNPVFNIAKYTMKDILQSKILLNIIFLGIFLLIITYVAFQFTYGEPSRVALDFGLGTLSLSSVAISLFMGLGLLSDEINSRTVYMILSRPVARWQFILGKILGLSFVLLINMLLLSCLTLSVFLFIGGQLSSLICMSLFFIFLEALIVLCLVSVLTLITGKVLTVLITLILYVTGHGIQEAMLTTMVKKNPALEQVLEAYHFVLPGFYKLNLKNEVLYEQAIGQDYLYWHSAYGLFYVAFLILLAVFIFERKNLD